VIGTISCLAGAVGNFPEGVLFFLSKGLPLLSYRHIFALVSYVINCPLEPQPIEIVMLSPVILYALPAGSLIKYGYAISFCFFGLEIFGFFIFSFFYFLIFAKYRFKELKGIANLYSSTRKICTFFGLVV